MTKLSEDDPERVERLCIETWPGVPPEDRQEAWNAQSEQTKRFHLDRMRAALAKAGPSVVIVDAEALVHVQRAQVNALELELERAEARLADAVANTAELRDLQRTARQAEAHLSRHRYLEAHDLLRAALGE